MVVEHAFLAQRMHNLMRRLSWRCEHLNLIETTRWRPHQPVRRRDAIISCSWLRSRRHSDSVGLTSFVGRRRRYVGGLLWLRGLF